MNWSSTLALSWCLSLITKKFRISFLDTEGPFLEYLPQIQINIVRIVKSSHKSEATLRKHLREDDQKTALSS